jgi:hypothetical protein
MKTYARDRVGNGNQESFAEAVVNTIYCQNDGACNPGQGQKIMNFPLTCSNTFNFIKNNVFGSGFISSGSSPVPTSLPETEIFQPPASQAASESLKSSDINNDGKTNLLDWNILSACSIFNSIKNNKTCPVGSEKQQTADLDGNGVVDQDDFTLWIKQFNSSKAK